LLRNIPRCLAFSSFLYLAFLANRLQNKLTVYLNPYSTPHTPRHSLETL